jgi:signal peptidase I
VVLRPDEYFVLGDDAANSLDSRHRGPVGTDAIVGRPVWVYFSRDAERGAIRWSRIGRAIE